MLNAARCIALCCIVIGPATIDTSAAAGSPAKAQSSTDSPVLAFDVASVKQNRSAANSITFNFSPGGQFDAINVTLRDLIRQAYRLPTNDSLLVGGPGWIGSERFDVVAKAARGTTFAQADVMLRALLQEHFKLMARAETRPLPVYRLVVASSDRRLGPQLRPSAAGCAAQRAAADAAVPAPQDKGFCGSRGGRGQMILGGRTMAQVIQNLSRHVDRPVIDRTALDGEFDVTLEWTPELAAERGAGEPPPVDPNAVSIFTAIQEQLGLKLEADRGPVEVLVIDHVERPLD